MKNGGSVARSETLGGKARLSALLIDRPPVHKVTEANALLSVAADLRVSVPRRAICRPLPEFKFRDCQGTVSLAREAFAAPEFDIVAIEKLAGPDRGICVVIAYKTSRALDVPIFISPAQPQLGAGRGQVAASAGPAPVKPRLHSFPAA